MKILFIVPYPRHQAPSQRFRFEQYLTILESKGAKIVFSSFLKGSQWKVFFRPGHAPIKAWLLFTGFLRRISLLGAMRSFDFIFIHREAAPVGPPIVEWAIAKLLRKRIIYDFDDAIWLTDRERESRIVKMLKSRSKVAKICQWSFRVSCGNEYLKSYALGYNSRTIINPTTIELDGLPAKTTRHEQSDRVVVGWTGSHSTLKYLKPLESTLAHLQSLRKHVAINVIADQDPGFEEISYTYTQWSSETEVEDLLKIDIGIMPLPDDLWTRGKCGFKALQFMALGIPCIASPVGVNTKIITHGQNGLLATEASEWLKHLLQLVDSPDERRRLGNRGREKVNQEFSVSSNSANFLSLFSL